MPRIPDASALGARPVPQAGGGIAQYRVQEDGVAPIVAGAGQALQGAGRTIAATGQTLDAAGEEMWRAVKIEEEKINSVQAEEAFNRLRERQIELTVGPKDGFANVKGGAAVSRPLFRDYTERFGAEAKAIEESLANDEQRQKFRLRAGVAGLQFKENLLQHVMRETDAHARQTLEVAMNTEINAVAGSPQDDAAMRFSLERVTNLLKGEIERQGLTGTEAADALKVAQATARDKMLTARVEALLYREPLAADAIFRANAKDITNPALRLTLQHKVNQVAIVATTSLEATKIVDQVRQAVPPAAPVMFDVGGGPRSSAGDLSVPRSVRNNNPGNIEKSSIRWAGQVEGDDPRFVTFATYEDGMRAMQQNLLAYQNRHGLNTVDAIIRRWAPAQENGEPSTKNYVTSVARALGVDPKAPIDLKDPTTMAAMTQAMANFEAGGQAPTATGGTRRVSQAPTNPSPFVQNTNGLPTSRDLAAQLPIMLMQVERRANELYGTDPANPDRQAFVRGTRREIEAAVSSDVRQLNAIQKQAQGQLMNAVMGLTPDASGNLVPTGGKGTDRPGAVITSFSQIQRDPKLMQAWQMMDPAAQGSMINLINKNLQATDKGDPVLFRELFNRINQEPGTPGKIDFYQQIIDPRVADRLSMEQITRLRTEIDKSETPGGRSVRQLRAGADRTVEAWFRTNLNTNVNFLNQKLTNPSAYIDWTNQWNEAVGRKIDEYAKAGKDPRPLFMAGTPESVIDPKYLQTFMGTTSTPAQGLAAAADQVRAGQAPAVVPPIAQPKEIDTREKLDAWFQTLPATQTTFTGTDGKVRLIPGRQAAPAAAPAPAAAAPAMDAQGKLVPPPAATAPAAQTQDAELTVEDIKVYEPTTVAAGIAGKRKKAVDAQEQERQRLAIEGRAGFLEGVGKIITGVAKAAYPGMHVADAAGKVGRAIAGAVPTEMDSVLNGWADIKRTRVVGPQDAVLIERALEYGLPPKDEALARAVLKKLEGKK